MLLLMNGFARGLCPCVIRCNSAVVLSNGRGTCAMKPRQEGGVVDKDLNVYGTSHLKIAGILLELDYIDQKTCLLLPLWWEQILLAPLWSLGRKLR
jgi:hypothetical protein